jgi:PleD family two-component response regulator
MSVVTATEGVEAMQVVSQIVPDVILAEVTVPKLDGFALKERLSRSSELSSIPFVIISHRKNDALIQRAASLGILHYYRKPLSSVEVSGLVRNLVKQGGS